MNALQKIFRGSPSKAAAYHVSMTFYSDSIALAFANRENEIKHCAVYPLVNTNPLQLLMALVKNFALHGCECTLVLSPEDYKLILSERPDIPNNEMRVAARWQIKDFIDFPVDEAVIDVVSIPSSNTSHKRPMMYVVAAHKALLNSYVDIIRRSGLQLARIDITEMGICHLLLPEIDQNDAGIIYLTKTTQGICIVQEQTLYLTRKFNFNLDELAACHDSIVMNLCTEIQRSIHYYQSQLSHKTLDQLILLPTPFDNEMLIKLLREKLHIAVNLHHIVVPTALPVEMLSNCFAVIGGLYPVGDLEHAAAH